MRNNPHIKEWIKCFNSIAPNTDPQVLFRDWCHCFALALANSVTPKHSDLWERREAQYLDIVGRYSKKDIAIFPELCAHLTNAFERDPFDDYLGSIYMELFGGNKKLGQCFTPIDVCKACAQVTIEPKEGEVQTLADECCGASAMAIAACGRFQELGIPWQRKVKFVLGDVDALCVHMSYIQMSLLGARAEVYHRDAITRKCWDMYVTPMEILWPMKYGRRE